MLIKFVLCPDCHGTRPLFPQWSHHVYPQFLPPSHSIDPQMPRNFGHRNIMSHYAGPSLGQQGQIIYNQFLLFFILVLFPGPFFYLTIDSNVLRF